MVKTVPVTAAQYALLADAEAKVGQAVAAKTLIVQTILAGHDITAGTVSSITPDGLVVDDGVAEDADSGGE